MVVTELLEMIVETESFESTSSNSASEAVLELTTIDEDVSVSSLHVKAVSLKPIALQLVWLTNSLLLGSLGVLSQPS